jgi:hemerythrin superfamily protein
MPQTAQQDAVRFLSSQHDEIRHLFQTVAESSGESRREAFETLVRLLAVHETAEEMVVYPALRDAGGEGSRVADARIDEEDRAKKMLADLEKLDPASPEFDQLFREVRVAVEAHAENEEREVFPLLEESRDDGQLRRMAAALEAAERMAPTRPHKAAPESAVGNALVGPFVSVVDRVRDAMRDAMR